MTRGGMFHFTLGGFSVVTSLNLSRVSVEHLPSALAIGSLSHLSIASKRLLGSLTQFCCDY